MNHAIHIRQYQDSDLEPCRRLWQELVEWHREIYSDCSIGGNNSGFLFDEHLAKVGASQIYVAIADRSVIGLVGFELKKQEADLEPVIVTAAWRKKGVGAMLVKKAVNEVRNKGVKYLNVMPVARNAEAIRFFHKMGFNNVGQVQLFIDFSNRKWQSSLFLHDSEFNY